MKKGRLGKVFDTIPPRGILIPLDLTGESPGQALAMHGFAPDKPALFVMEGVTRYLPAVPVSRIFANIGKSAPGSLLVFTDILRDIIDGQSAIQGAGSLKARLPLHFSPEQSEIRTFPGQFHLALLEDVGAGRIPGEAPAACRAKPPGYPGGKECPGQSELIVRAGTS